MNLALTPSLPIRAKFKKMGPKDIVILEVAHEKGENMWVPMPRG